MKHLLSIVLLVVMTISGILAAPLKNVPCTITQPNGEVIHCFVSGDEFFNYYHDAAGYTIIMNKETGYYTYGIEQDGLVVPSEFIVGQVEPSTVAALTPGARISDEIIMARRIERERQIVEYNPAPRTREMNHGRMTNLVVFISFQSDTVFPKSYGQVDAMFNDTSSNTANSLKNFYKHVSYNQFTIQSYLFPQPGPNDIILSYHDIHSENYYKQYSSQNPYGYADDNERTEREFTLLDSAIRYVKNFIPSDLDLDYNNDGNVDNVVFVINCGVSGWSELLWPHRWSIYDPEYSVYIHGKRVYDFNLILADDEYYFDIGTLCHEMFHSLSAPDLYSSSGNTSYNGKWDLMEGTTNPPQNMGAYMKSKYGHWIELPEADRNGLYTLYPVSTSPHCAYKIFPDRIHHPNQFVVIEFRNTSTPFDGTVYGTGAVIYRINDDFNGNHSTNYSVGSYPEVYTFRKGGVPTDAYTPPTLGNLNQSYFGGYNMYEFSEYTDPYPFYCNGTQMKGFRIVNIHNMGDSLQFYLVKNEIVVDTFPWVEPFETETIPYYCHHEFENNSSVWTTNTGNQSGTIATAHSGSKNALFYTVSNSTTKLVMPVFDFTFLTDPVLSFWCAQASGSNYMLKVYYKVSDNSDWTLLQTYSSFTGQWTQKTLNLPNPSSTYQIAFEAIGGNGSGLVLDDIVVSGTPITAFNINASAGDHGQISPSGDVEVSVHGTQDFILTPEQGYTIDQLMVDGVSQQRALLYTFENVVTDHTIAVSFRTANTNTLNATPAALYFSTSGGDTSVVKSVSVVMSDFTNTDDIMVQSEAPFYISNNQTDFGLQTTVPYNGGLVYVVFAPPFGGNYHKTLTVSKQTETKTVNLNGSATGIEEQQGDEVQLYPNPVGNSLNLVFDANNLPEKVEIFDVCGRTVMNMNVVDASTLINVESLKAGVYFVKADNFVKKFIKK